MADWFQINHEVIVHGQKVATTQGSTDMVKELRCDLCNEMMLLEDGFTFDTNGWQCSKCKALN
jgi:hypothetical protein